MATQHKHSVGVFASLDAAQRTVANLREHGFTADEIGIIGGHVQDESVPVPVPPQLRAPERNIPRAVAAGGVFGALIGALVLAVIPGLGWVTGSGRWFELLGGAILGAAVGGVLFALAGLGFSWPRSRLYERELQEGRFIVAVQSDRRQREALAVLGQQAVHAETE